MQEHCWYTQMGSQCVLWSGNISHTIKGETEKYIEVLKAAEMNILNALWDKAGGHQWKVNVQCPLFSLCIGFISSDSLHSHFAKVSILYNLFPQSMTTSCSRHLCFFWPCPHSCGFIFNQLVIEITSYVQGCTACPAPPHAAPVFGIGAMKRGQMTWIQEKHNYGMILALAERPLTTSVSVV